MGKKDLKRLLKFYKFHLNSTAVERSAYRARAEKAEATVRQLVDAIYALNSARTLPQSRELSDKLSAIIAQARSSVNYA